MKVVALCSLLGAATFVCLDVVLPAWAALLASPLVVLGMAAAATEEV